MARKVSLVLSHWYHLTEGLQESPQQFYASVEEAINKRQLPQAKRSRIDYREGGILSAKREYLRIRRDEYVFDICAAPFGNGFFVSWWLGETQGFFMSLLTMIPFWGEMMVNTFRTQTYYRLDVALMFQESIHLSVLEVVDKITQAQGLRVLSEMDRKPIMTGLFKQ